MYKRGDGYHDFPSKLLCLTRPNHFVEESFCVSESLGYRNFLGLGGKSHDSLKKLFCLTVTKTSLGEPFSVSLFSVIEKIFA